MRSLREINDEIELCNAQMDRACGPDGLQDATRMMLGGLTGPVMEALEKRLKELHAEKESLSGP